MKLLDPSKLAKLFWPDVVFYDKQVDIIYSMVDNDETFVPAGNMLGKDFVAGFVVLWIFISALKLGQTCRVVTTSVKDDHLRVLWGEISRFIKDAKYPLVDKDGGPFIFNHRDIRRASEGIQGYSYLRGMVSEKGEGMAGHHADVAVGIIDEASGVDDLVYTQMDTWAKRKLIFGNTNPCENFFRKGIKAGDLMEKV